MDTHLPAISRDRPCDLCGDSRFELLADRDRRGGALATVICRCCGLVCHAAVPSEQELAKYYEETYRRDYNGEYVPRPHRVVREWSRGRELLRLLQPFTQPSDHVLEIGSGIGCTVSNFQRSGFSAAGVEPGAGFRQYAIDKLGIRVWPGVLADQPHQPMADVVLLVHVLEHLSAPGVALWHIHDLLREHGRCYIEVPNAGAPHAAPGKIFHYAHIYNFTADTLSMLAAKNGYRIVRWFGSQKHKNLRVLLERQDNCQWSVIPGSYERSLAAMRQYSKVRYYLRPSYVRGRLQTFFKHASDRVLATRRMRRIEANLGGDAKLPLPASHLASRVVCPRG